MHMARLHWVADLPRPLASDALSAILPGHAKPGPVTEFLGKNLFTFGDASVTASGLLALLLIMVIAYGVSWSARSGLRRVASRRDSSMQSAYYTVGRVLHYTLMLVGLMIALGSIGVDLSRVTLLVSAIGVGLGFGMQAMISNFVSGLIILFERHLKVGDFVELESGVTGEVREINIRATRITTNDSIDVLVPNSEFVNGRVVNWTLDNLSRRVRVKFGASYLASKGRVRDAVLKAASSVSFTLTDEDHRPQVWLTGFGDSSLEYELVVWLRPEAVKRPATVHAAYCWAIDDALRDAGIEIPFPQRDLHLRSVFGLEGEDARRFMKGQDLDGPGQARTPDVEVVSGPNDALEEAVRLSKQRPGTGDDEPAGETHPAD